MGGCCRGYAFELIKSWAFCSIPEAPSRRIPTKNFYHQNDCDTISFTKPSLMALEETDTKKRKRKHNHAKKHHDIVDPPTSIPIARVDKSTLPHKKPKTHGRREAQEHPPAKPVDEPEEWDGLDEADSAPTATSATTHDVNDAPPSNPAADEITQIGDSVATVKEGNVDKSD